MVGIWVYVGIILVSFIFLEVIIFQRLIKMDEGMRCWYDILFIVVELFLVDEDIVIFVGLIISGIVLFRIDLFEVYGCVKDEFGWKEKMDVVIDMEVCVFGYGLFFLGFSKKRALIRFVFIEE